MLLLAELPGAPSNLVISNISPRSATLRFRPGPGGKTSISRWIVEGQVRRACMCANYMAYRPNNLHYSRFNCFSPSAIALTEQQENWSLLKGDFSL